MTPMTEVECEKCQDTGVANGWVDKDGDYDFESCDCMDSA